MLFSRAIGVRFVPIPFMLAVPAMSFAFAAVLAPVFPAIFATCMFARFMGMRQCRYGQGYRKTRGEKQYRTLVHLLLPPSIDWRPCAV